MVGNAQNTAAIFCSMCLAVEIGRVTEAHMYAHYFVTGFLEQQGSHGGIQPSTQRHGKLSFGHTTLQAKQY
jgi:hypothetical protein